MKAYLPILMFLLAAIGFAGGTILLSSLIVPRRRDPVKMSPYECGVEPVGTARERFTIKFYLVAVLFILFDIEAVFLYPWAVIFKSFIKAGFGPFIFGEMMVFIVILFVGYIYIWKKGALEWE